MSEYKCPTCLGVRKVYAGWGLGNREWDYRDCPTCHGMGRVSEEIWHTVSGPQTTSGKAVTE